MKKCKILRRISILALVAALLLCQVPAAFAADVGLSIQEMIDSQIANPGQAITKEEAHLEYQFLFGNFANGTLKHFTSHTDQHLYEGGTNPGDPLNGVWYWQWRCNAGSDTVLKITAKENMALTIEMQEDGSFHAGWAIGTTFRYIQENAEGSRREIKKITVQAEAQPAENITTKTHLAAGEVLYIVYSGGGLMTTDFCPWFTVNTETYDASQSPFVLIPDGAPATEDSTDYSSLVTEHVVSGGAAIEKPLATYQFLYGEMDTEDPVLQPFTKFEGAGYGEPNDALFDDASVNVGGSLNCLQRWQWRCCGAADTVLKITAKEDLVLRIYTIETFKDAWATHSAWRFIAENEEGLRLVAKRMDVTVVMEPDYCETVIHMAKGDTLYMTYSIMNGDMGTATATYIPQFELKREGYDPEQRPAFDTVDAVNALKTETVTKLEGKYSELMGDGSAYSTARRIEMEGIRDEAISALKDLSTEEEINALYADAAAKMEAVPTLAKEAEELNAYKAKKKEELAKEFTKEMYSAKNWETVEGFLTQANADIDAAKSAAVVNTVVAKAKANINTVEKGGASSDVPWGIIGGAAAAVLAVAIVVIVVLKKKGAKKA